MDVSNTPVKKINTEATIRDRIAGINKKLVESKQALREWVQEQTQNLDLEEEELRNKDEAIDLTPLEEPDLTPIGVSDDAKLAELLAQADALMSTSKLESADSSDGGSRQRTTSNLKARMGKESER